MGEILWRDSSDLSDCVWVGVGGESAWILQHKTMTTKRFTIELDTELCEWLDAEAQCQQRSRNGQIAHILQIIKTQSEMRHNMLDERWREVQARKFTYGDRIG